MFEWFKKYFATKSQPRELRLPKEHNRERTLEILKSKISKYTDGSCICAECGHNKFDFTDAYHLQLYQDGMLLMGTAVMPIIAINCLNCGHLEFFSAIRLGIINKETGTYN